MFGAGVGAIVFGTANLWLSKQQGFARSIEGAVARHPPWTILMVLVGIILLLPGVCAAGSMITGASTWLALWAFCFLISAGGAFLLYSAFRKPPATP
jgi:hypothetical protein